MSRAPVLSPAAAYALWAPNYPAHAHNPVMSAEERAMLTLMPADLHGKNVLDAGCGSARYMLRALRRGATHAIGVDLSEAMLRRAYAELTACHFDAGIGLAQGSVTALPVPNAWADVTVCGLVIGHLEHLRSALRELHRVTSRAASCCAATCIRSGRRLAGNATSRQTASVSPCSTRSICIATGMRHARRSGW